MSHFRQLPSPARPKHSLQPPVLLPCMLLFRKHAILYQSDLSCRICFIRERHRMSHRHGHILSRKFVPVAGSFVFSALIS